MNKLKEYMQVKKNPELAIFQILENIKKENDLKMEQMLQDFRREIKSILDNEKQDSVFKNLEPVKVLAQKVAKEEINNFKTETDEQVRTALKEFIERKDEIVKNAENQIENSVNEFNNAKETLKGESFKNVKEIEIEFSNRTNDIVEEMSKTIKAFKDELIFLKSNTSDKIDNIVSGIENLRGPKGEIGKDGSPDKPEEIVKKLNTLQGVLDLKVIEGLDGMIKKWQEELSKRLFYQKKGGGMGNVITETPSGTVNNSNTVFTLSYVPKTNSLILLWQGQFQRSGASFEYTISGKTITFNTAPTSGELYCWYVR